MERCKLCWWDDYNVPSEEQETEPHLKGTTAIQFIKTSNVTIHTIDPFKKIFVNIFSCKDFNGKEAASFTANWFNGEIVSFTEIPRK